MIPRFFLLICLYFASASWANAFDEDFAEPDERCASETSLETGHMDQISSVLASAWSYVSGHHLEKNSMRASVSVRLPGGITRTVQTVRDAHGVSHTNYDKSVPLGGVGGVGQGKSGQEKSVYAYAGVPMPSLPLGLFATIQPILGILFSRDVAAADRSTLTTSDEDSTAGSTDDNDRKRSESRDSGEHAGGMVGVELNLAVGTALGTGMRISDSGDQQVYVKASQSLGPLTATFEVDYNVAEGARKAVGEVQEPATPEEIEAEARYERAISSSYF